MMRQRLGLMMCWLLTVPVVSAADVIIDDGLVHEIDHPVADSVHVYDDAAGTGNASVVIVSDGAAFTSEVQFWDHSRLTMSGGACHGDLAMNNSSSASISGGLVDGIVFSGDDSTMNISGDADIGACFILGNATFIVEGDASVGRVETLDSPTVEIRGGRFGYMLLTGATVDVSGGVFQDHLDVGSLDSSISGGAFQSSIWVGGALDVSGGGFSGEIVLSTWDADVTFVGSDFAIDGRAFEPGTTVDDLGLTRVARDGWQYLTGVLTGTLADGTSIDQSIYLVDLDGYGHGEVHVIPEPASLWLVCACGVVLRRRSN